MIMAYWNGMVWEVSSKQIAYMEALTTAYSIDTDTNADKEGKKPTEEIGMSLIEYAFNTTYRVETGTSDVLEMTEIWKSMIGKAAPLIIGDSIFGPDKMQLQSVNISNIELSPKGVMRAATCAFKFKEYAEEPAGIKAGTIASGSAVSVGASGTDKTQKKPYVIYMPTTYYWVDGKKYPVGGGSGGKTGGRTGSGGGAGSTGRR